MGKEREHQMQRMTEKHQSKIWKPKKEKENKSTNNVQKLEI